MLDNFGLGEFFFLAMLALLFFGPERLPKIGAQFGRWVSGLTRYSKAFLTEWREEALAVHDAVEEVKGIRDEIIAARAELSSTLDTAREDLTEGVDVARDAVTGARFDVAKQIENQQQQTTTGLDQMAKKEKGELEPDGGREQGAVDRTQQIVDGLLEKRQSADGQAGDDEAGAETEWERNQRLIAEGLGQKQAPLPRLAHDSPPAVQVSAPEAVTSAEETTEPAADQDEDPKDSAFERSQRIFDELKRKRAGEAVKEPATAAEEAEPPTKEAEASAEGAVEKEPERPERATAFDRTQEILQGLEEKRSGAQKKEPVAATSPMSVEPAEFEQLSAQVAQLSKEMAALRQELQTLRGAAAGVDETLADELPVEEAV